MRAIVALALLASACTTSLDVGRLDAPSTTPAEGDGARAESGAERPTDTRLRWIAPLPTGEDLRGIVTGSPWVLGAGGTSHDLRAPGGALVWREESETTFFAGAAVGDDDAWLLGERRGASEVRRVLAGRVTGDYGLARFSVHALAGRRADDVVALAHPWAVHFDGVAWREEGIEATAPLRALAAASDGTFWAVGDGGALVVRAGGAWQRYLPVTANPVVDFDRDYVSVAASARGLIAGYQTRSRGAVGVVRWAGGAWADEARFDDGCDAEVLAPRPMARGARALLEDDGRAFVVLGTRCVARFDGSRWTLAHAPEGASLSAVGHAADGDAVVVGSRGLVVAVSGPSIEWPAPRPTLRDAVAEAGAAFARDDRGVVAVEEGQVRRALEREGVSALAAWHGAILAAVPATGGSEVFSIEDGRVRYRVPFPVRGMRRHGDVLVLVGAGALAFATDDATVTTLPWDEGSSPRDAARLDDGRWLVTATWRDDLEGSQPSFVREIVLLEGASRRVLTRDRSAVAEAPLASLGGRWLAGGLPAVEAWPKTGARVATGDDAPVVALEPCSEDRAWALGGGRLRLLDARGGADPIFASSRDLTSIACSAAGRVTLVGDSGAVLVGEVRDLEGPR